MTRTRRAGTGLPRRGGPSDRPPPRGRAVGDRAATGWRQERRSESATMPWARRAREDQLLPDAQLRPRRAEQDVQRDARPAKNNGTNRTCDFGDRQQACDPRRRRPATQKASPRRSSVATCSRNRRTSEVDTPGIGGDDGGDGRGDQTAPGATISPTRPACKMANAATLRVLACSPRAAGRIPPIRGETRARRYRIRCRRRPRRRPETPRRSSTSPSVLPAVRLQKRRTDLERQERDQSRRSGRMGMASPAQRPRCRFRSNGKHVQRHHHHWPDDGSVPDGQHGLRLDQTISASEEPLRNKDPNSAAATPAKSAST